MDIYVTASQAAVGAIHVACPNSDTATDPRHSRAY
jgi:hypothetical protein